MPRHARRHALVPLPRTVHVEIPQSHNLPGWFLFLDCPCQIFQLHLGKGVGVGRRQRITDPVHPGTNAVGGRTRRVHDRGFFGPKIVEQAAKPLHIIVRLDFLILKSGVGDRGEVEHGVRTPPTELRLPIQPGDVRRHKIAPKALQVGEGTAPEIVDHRQTRRRKLLLKAMNQIRADKSGPSCDPNRLHLFKVI